MFQEKFYPYLLVLVQLSCLVYILKTASLLADGYAGIMVETLGIFSGLLAIYNMGLGNFNVSPRTKESASMVTHGIYKYIRHPMYSAQLLALLPLIIEYDNWFRTGAYLLLVIALLLKIRYEEAHLQLQFEGYTDYMKKSKRLVPFLF